MVRQSEIRKSQLRLRKQSRAELTSFQPKLYHRATINGPTASCLQPQTRYRARKSQWECFCLEGETPMLISEFNHLCPPAPMQTCGPGNARHYALRSVCCWLGLTRNPDGFEHQG